MPRITPLPWKKVECVLLLLGYVFDRQKGSHRVYISDHAERNIVLPQHNKDLTVPLLLGIINEIGIDRETFLQLLSEC